MALTEGGAIMAKVRVSQHSGREGGGRHNDRRFSLDKAQHIDATKTGANCYWRWDGKNHPERSFDESELAFYAERYGVAQEAKNARYTHEGHADRCKTTEDLARGKQTRPEEIIIQIGNKDAHTDQKIFLEAVNDYFGYLQDWNREHGKHMQIISIAVHYDETTPHAHIRRTWDVQSKDGAVLGQNKALKAAGVPLPDPDKPEGRYNNRKMTFDAMMREKWLDICEARGIEVEREPVPDMRHKDKAEYIRQEIGAEIDHLTAYKAAAEQEAAWAREDVAETSEKLQKLEKQLQHTQYALDNAIEARRSAINSRTAQLARGQNWRADLGNIELLEADPGGWTRKGHEKGYLIPYDNMQWVAGQISALVDARDEIASLRELRDQISIDHRVYRAEQATQKAQEALQDKQDELDEALVNLECYEAMRRRQPDLWKQYERAYRDAERRRQNRSHDHDFSL